MGQLEFGKAWGWVKDFLAILVIPLLLWGIKLEVGNALRDERIASLQEEISELRSLETGVQDNSLLIVRLEGKVDTANGRLDDIKNLLAR